MKKLFLSIILVLGALPFFALELQHDAFIGDSLGLDTAVVFGQGKIKNAVGLYFDAHQTYVYDEYSSYSPNPEDSSITYSNITAMNFGLYYQFTWSPTFANFGNFGIGMDLPLQIGIGANSAHGVNIFAGLVPAFKFEFQKLDLLIGYRLTGLLAEAVQDLPFMKSACTISVRYNIKKGGAVKSSGNTKTTGKTKSGDLPDTSSDSKVNVIPGSDIKTIPN